MDRIDLAGLTKQTLHNAAFLCANGVRSAKWLPPPEIVNLLIERKAIDSDDYNLARDEFELALLKEAIRQGKPV